VTLIISWTLLFACADSEPEAPSEPEGELIFVRDGVVAPAGVEAGRPLPGGRALVSRSWSPGEAISLGGLSGVAPRQAGCVTLFQHELGDVSRLMAMGAEAPNTTMVFSPDAERLAVGTYLGEVLVLDGWTGQVIARRGLAETMVKHLAFSADGQTLYAAEQSPDAYVHAFAADSLEIRWSLRLADFVETSPAPAAEDIFGVYTLPAAYGLSALEGGDLLVSALHSWPVDGERRNRSQVLRVSSTGEIRARWPEVPADATFKHPVVDGALVAVIVDRTAAGPAPEGLPIGGVQLLDLETLTPLASVTTPPLSPWFQSASIWGGLDISESDDALFMGFIDGRARLTSLKGEERFLRDSGAPILAGEVPIYAGIGWGLLNGGRALYVNTSTYIPYGAAAPELRPPTTHPNENTLWSVGLGGEVDWTWSGEQRPQGLSVSPDGEALLMGAGNRDTDDRRDLYGALLFDLEGGGSGAERLEAFCPTEGPVFFRHALTDDGRAAVSEHPYPDGEGGFKGAYRVTVLR